MGLDSNHSGNSVGISKFGDGHSGFTYRVELAAPAVETTAYVLRLAPCGARARGPADIGRQGAIMAALHGAGVPVLRVLDSSSEPAIDGRSLALMDLADGTGWEELARRRSHEQVAGCAVDALHALQRVPPATVLSARASRRPKRSSAGRRCSRGPARWPTLAASARAQRFSRARLL